MESAASLWLLRASLFAACQQITPLITTTSQPAKSPGKAASPQGTEVGQRCLFVVAAHRSHQGPSFRKEAQHGQGVGPLQWYAERVVGCRTSYWRLPATRASTHPAACCCQHRHSRRRRRCNDPLGHTSRQGQGRHSEAHTQFQLPCVNNQRQRLALFTRSPTLITMSCPAR